MQRIRNSLPAICALWIAASTASAAELNGIVLDPAGRAVTGVTIQLLTNEFAAVRIVDLGETTTTDEGGRFRITVPETWIRTPDTIRQELTLLAHSADHGTGATVVSRNLPLPTQTLTIKLEHWSLREVQLVDPDGRPAPDVQLKLKALLSPIVMPLNYTRQEDQRQMAPLPDELVPAARTNEDGIAEMLLPPIDSISMLEADLGDGVTVTWSVTTNTSAVPKEWSRRIQLPGLRQISLHIATDTPEALANLTLSVGTTPRQSYGPTTSVGHKLDIDANGEASLTTRGDAILYFHASSTEFPDWRLDRQYIENTSAIDESGIQLNFRKGITASGRVVTTDGARAANLNLFVLGGFSAESARTDDGGEFELLVAPGQQLLVLVSDPGYRGPPQGPESLVMIPPDAEAFTIPDVVVSRLRTVAGRVSDSAGRPVAEASILMLWDEPHPQVTGARNNRQETVRTDDEGRFEIAGIDPDATLQIAAWNDAAASEAMLRIAPTHLADPLEIVVSAESLIAAHGRVVDQGGAGISNLPIILRHRTLQPLVDATLPVGEDVLEVTTDSDGRFATQRTLLPWGEYIAVIRPGTNQQALSGWRSVGGNPDLQLPEIVTSASTELDGRVVTTGGDPVPGATVQLLTSSGQTRATTGEDGQFTIEAVGGRGPLLIASADGFSFNGLELRGPSRDVLIVLARRGEPAPNLNEDVPPAQPPAWTPQERRDLAVRLFESLPDSDLATRARALAALARVDPEYVTERLEHLPENNPAAWQVRGALAMSIAADRPAEALDFVEQIPENGMRLYIMLAVEPHAGLDDDERRELLARIIQDGRGVANADHRVMSIGLVGERLLDLGQRESGEALLREGQRLAENLAPAAFSGYVRGAFAAELAQIDADAALALIEPLTDVDEFNRHLTNVAHELAAFDPERAAECLELIRETPTAYIVRPRDGAVIRACYRMVRVDPDRAVELARSVENEVMRVRCLGVMADSLLAQDDVTADGRARAAQLVSDAWDILSAYPDTHDQSEVAWLFPSTMAGLLLPATAELLPNELPSRVWQSIALRRPMTDSGPYVYSGATCGSEIALLLSEIDPVQSGRVAAWLPDDRSGKSVFEYFLQSTRTAPELIATVSPDRVERYLAALEDDTSRNRVTLSFIAALSRNGESRQRAILGDMGLWFPDDEDLGPME